MGFNSGFKGLSEGKVRTSYSCN